ncbi:hypothetical protein AWC38_SpisGene1253 [Stylophora pistillata]|uniref:Uncharacterized protein n=1 Tax=Stylophora pistillata TaxID=50429 RepID=A0A2B4SZH1_STYPI|nr:hypothetical protein AWC38_SpisGene1253 [Stylophora pistillata]
MLTLLQGQRPEESNQQEDEPYRLAERMAAINVATVTSTPAATPPRPKANAFTSDWTLGCRSGTDSQSSGDDEVAESTGEFAMSAFTDAMEKLNPLATSGGRVSPLTFLLKSTSEEAKEPEKEICIDKATEACTLVCDAIALKAGEELFQACFTPDKGTSHMDLVPLIRAYSNAMTSTLKTQILSLTRKLRLSSGEKITMPNVIRKVTRSTMVTEYLQFCEEEQFEPLSRSTLFRILEVREASQQKSLSGLDNTAADGSAGFAQLLRIVDELNQIGLAKNVADELRRALSEGKRYLKTQFQNHCQEDEGECLDHCRKFDLNDLNDPDFQEQCSHQHALLCSQCDKITSVLQKMQQIVKDNKTLVFYSEDQKNDLLYDIQKSSEAIVQWKAHIMRSVNQECAKQDIIAKLDQTSCLLFIDWAMKFLQLRSLFHLLIHVPEGFFNCLVLCFLHIITCFLVTPCHLSSVISYKRKQLS